MARRWVVEVCTIAYLFAVPGASVVGVPAAAAASWFEALVMPGEVAKKHAPAERTCHKCHDRFDTAAQDGLCLACHKDVAADLQQQRGYHGQAPGVTDRPCKACHTEHKGRAAAIVRLDRETFDHGLTDRPLRGAHTRVRCDDCHLSGKRYRDAPGQCHECHGRKDPHEGCLGTGCDSCHDEGAWKVVRFDHDRAAFRLDGRHGDVRCESCHKTKRYKPTPRDCYGCHERDDKHRGSFGRDCRSCHTAARKWAATDFDHARKTRFPLVGRHLGSACGACHRDGLPAARTPATCHGCHERDDRHHGQFGRTCDTCHTAGDWKRPTFAHDRSTRFALRGRHGEIRCTACHHAALYEEHLDTSCIACHRTDDVHHGREGTRCDRCHNERGWRREVIVDHDATRFPLTGAHVGVACMRCHRSPALNEVGRECVSCHETADVHHGREGPRCGDCHSVATWKVPASARHRGPTPLPQPEGTP